MLYLVVAEANDVMVNVANDSTFVLGFGYPADLEVVEQLWASLATQMASAAARRLRAGEHKKAGIAAVSWRLSFYEGWMHAVQAAAGAGTRAGAARARRGRAGLDLRAPWCCGPSRSGSASSTIRSPRRAVPGAAAAGPPGARLGLAGR